MPAFLVYKEDVFGLRQDLELAYQILAPRDLVPDKVRRSPVDGM